MALLEIQIYSEVLMKEVSLAVILPLPTITNMEYGDHVAYPDHHQKYQTLWLLHAATGDYTKCLRSSRIETYAREHQLAVVMPSLENSCGHNIPYYGDFFTFITEELPAKLGAVLPLSRKREHNFVAGPSIGGYTAFMLALRRPEQYAAAISLAGGLDLKLAGTNKNTERWFTLIKQSLFGENNEYYDPHIHDLEVIAQDLKESGKIQPRFYACCGEEDLYRHVGQGVIASMQAMGFDVTYVMGHGRHDWDYWDSHLREAIEGLQLNREFVE